MISQDRYVRMVYYMEQDVNWLLKNVVNYRPVLKQVFGVEIYNKIYHTLGLLHGNVQEMKQDLRVQGLI